jgi:hypothetical protein
MALAPPDADAELIRICHEFAEGQLADWYRYIVASDDEADELDEPLDWTRYDHIIATPATTPEGWHAKALAFTAWDRESYDDHVDKRDPSTTFLASLLRDMASARNAIIGRLRAEFGPLLAFYTPEGIWLGQTAGEKAKAAAAHEVLKAKWKAEEKEAQMRPRRKTKPAG